MATKVAKAQFKAMAREMLKKEGTKKNAPMKGKGKKPMVEETALVIASFLLDEVFQF
jgi:hypothetical protein